MKTFPSIKSKTSGGQDFDPVPQGTHFAFCTQLIDLGTQVTSFNGEERTRLELYLRFEVPEERVKFKKDGKEVVGPKIIGMTVTNSLSPKATLRHMLEAWRGRPFTEQELEGFELTSIVGQPCQIVVTHKPRKEGGVFANITNVLGLSKLQREAMKKGDLPKEPESDVVVYTPTAHDQKVFESLPKWIQEKIQDRIEENAPEGGETVPLGAGDASGSEDFDDDIPF